MDSRKLNGLEASTRPRQRPGYQGLFVLRFYGVGFWNRGVSTSRTWDFGSSSYLGLKLYVQVCGFSGCLPKFQGPGAKTLAYWMVLVPGLHLRHKNPDNIN